MKRYLILIPLLFLYSTLWAAEPVQLARMNPYILGAQASAAATTNYCNDANAVGCWYMNGGLSANGDTEVDRTSAGNDLAETSGDIPNSTDVPSGYSGKSRDFEAGDSEYLTIADGTELDINGENAKLTLATWVKAEATSGANEYGIISKYAVTGNQRQYLLEIVATGTNVFKFTCGISADGINTTNVSSTTTNYAAGTWYHVACVANDTDIRVYVNGSLDSTPGAHTTGIYNSSAVFLLGSLITAGYYFDGLIDEAIVLSRDLSATEISNIYSNGITGNKGGSD